jgi:RHS repeat-associated protein
VGKIDDSKNVETKSSDKLGTMHQPTNTANSGNSINSQSNQSQLPSISIPKGGGAISGIGEKFANNPVTGTGSMTVPIPLSPGRDGFGPQLTLNYDSGSGNGPFGFGWSLPIPQIKRKTDKGLPQYNDIDDSDVFMISGAEDLVPVFRQDHDGSWIANHPGYNRDPDEYWVRDQEGQLVVHEEEYNGYIIRRYRPRIEGLFARIERWTEQSSGDVHWRSITRDNVTSIYGQNNHSRIFDPLDENSEHPTRIFSWLICMTFDDKGNASVYEYAAENDANIDLDCVNEQNRIRTANRYLKRIKYGNQVSRLIEPDLSQAQWLFEVVFDYGEGHFENIPLDPARPKDEQHTLSRASIETDSQWAVRPDPFSSFRSGFEIRTYRRCQRILMFHRFEELGDEACLVRSMEFNYDDLDDSQATIIDAELAHQGSTRFASFIRSVTQSGYVRDESTPIVDQNGIQYVKYLKKSLPPLEFEYSRIKIQNEINYVDKNSLENLPTGIDGGKYQCVDLDGEGVSGILSKQEGAWYYKPGLGNAKFGEMKPLKNQLSLFALAGEGEQLVDLSGDGQIDVATFSGPTPGFYERTHHYDWERFKPFQQLPNISWNDPNLRFVDLNGDGHADILITEHDVFTWYPSLEEKGFGASRMVRKSWDEDKGPCLVLADGAQSIYLADMSGDGLTDLVRIRNGEICYWPNLGYGRFGAKINMDNAPIFDHPDQFDQKRIRLADIDGSGTNDIIYIGCDGIRLFFNLSGNSWSEERRLTQFPKIDNLTSVMTADIKGNGTACLVWSSPLPEDSGRQLCYIDLMGEKPHLLIRSVNNMGAETRIQYASSTQFYLEDKLAGKPWITRIPFPVHVVERVETFDWISRNRFVTRYAYHHGYFDGVEREFRGFGMVEQFDTEEYATLSHSTDFPTGSNVDESSHVPPILTRRWFHTGVYLGNGHVSGYFAGLIDEQDVGEYYREPGLNDNQARELLLKDTILPNDLNSDEEREACRALKGSLLREEVYALDHTEKESIPYTVTEQNFSVRLLQAKGQNCHAVFLTHARETIAYNYERTLVPVLAGQIADQRTASENSDVKWTPDPQVMHTLTLEVDNFGNVLKSATIGYCRRFVDTNLPQAIQDKQAATHITYTENRVTNVIDSTNDYRLPLPYDMRTYEITGLNLPVGQRRFTFDEITNAGINSTVLNYEQHPDSELRKRLIEHVRTFFRRNDLNGALPLGKLESRAIPFETYQLAFTPGLLEDVYENRVNNEMLEKEGRYVRLHDETGALETGWWIPSGKLFFSPNPDHSAAEELVFAKDHFFLPHRMRNPFHTNNINTESIVNYDRYNLMVSETTDALDNRITVGERQMDSSQPLVSQGQDYRVLQPALIMDPNRNRTSVVFDALGMVVGTAVMGKPEDNPAIGDSLTANFCADLTKAEIDQFFADPKGPLAIQYLDSATTRIIYDISRFWQQSGAIDQQPAFVATLSRETHTSDLTDNEQSKIQVSFSYSDGFGREIQKKEQAESGKVPVRDAMGHIIIGADGQPQMTHDKHPRWVGSGWTVFNNKGKPVRQYEPYFSYTHCFEFNVRVGDSPVLFYDPLSRVVATLHPNHTWEKVVFSPWYQNTWDVSDTVLITDPKQDKDVGNFCHRLPNQNYQPTWYEQRKDGALGSSEQSAALKSEVYAGTPMTAHFDSLGRTILTVAHNRFKNNNAPESLVNEFYKTHVIFDIEGNQREIIDAKDRVVMRYDYDMLGNRIHQVSMEAGARWMLNDIAGKPLYAWDDRSHRFRTSYDALQRPTASFLKENDTPEKLVQTSVYGESYPNPEQKNLRGQLVQLCDQAGIVTSEAYDFKGNQLSSQRQLAHDYKSTIDWSEDIILETETYTSRTRYDALNRPIQLIAPHSEKPETEINVIQPVYNDANLLEQVDAWLGRNAEPEALLDPVSASLHPVVNIDYDAKGQRNFIEYGNGAQTTYDYDPLTLQLKHLITRRDTTAFPDDCPRPPPIGWPGCEVQNLHYTYDIAGNITHIHDSAQQKIYFKNACVTPSADYTYDAIFRLIEATGREHLGQAGAIPVPHSHNDMPRIGLQHPGDGKAMGTYVERYIYDAVGNFIEMQHRGRNADHPGWKRTYNYNEASLIESQKNSNRLTSTQVGNGISNPQEHTYDAHGNMLTMPHLQTMQWDFNDQLKMTQRQKVNNQSTDSEFNIGERTWYVYDTNGQRIRKVTEGANGQIKDERIYLGGFEIYRRHDNNPLVRETLHIMDDKQRIALVETRTLGNEQGVPKQVIRYQLGNHLGSVSLELDDQARIISYEEYTPYGSSSYQAIRSQIEIPKRYRYTGKERDEESGFYYCDARYYANWIGRWLSCDPILILYDKSNFLKYHLTDENLNERQSNLNDEKRLYQVNRLDNNRNKHQNDIQNSPERIKDSINLYLYCFACPLVYVDPTGKVPWLVLAAIIVSKGIDYGWTTWDIWQSGKTLDDPDASDQDKLLAATSICLAVTLETIEPDDLTPVGVPSDDIVRMGIMKGLKEASEEGGWEAVEKYLKGKFGDKADEVIEIIRKKIDDASKSGDELASFAHNYNKSVGAAERVPSVLQTGGNKLTKNTAGKLNDYFGENLTKRDWGRALEGLKKDLGLPNNHHARILDNGGYVDDAGNLLGNIGDYLP